MKHAKQSTPKQVTGSLLGLDQDGELEVTHAFPSPDAGEDDDGSATDDYQLEMMKMLREVNVDNNTVGWYQTTYLGSFCTPFMIETQYQYQASISKNTVVLVYDPLQTSKASELVPRAGHRERTEDLGLNRELPKGKFGEIL